MDERAANDEREKVIEAAKKAYLKWMNGDADDVRPFYELMADFHLDMRRREWVPVSERLPKSEGEYICTVVKNTDGSGRSVKLRWFDPTDVRIILVWRQNIVAWKELDAPFGGGEEGEG